MGVKGKSKAVAEYDDSGEQTSLESTTKVKKAYHKIEWAEHLEEGEEHVSLEFDNGHWHDWDREFGCKMFEAMYDGKWGRDDVGVKTKEGVNPIHGLIVGFAVAYYFHPSRYAAQMNSRARSMA